MKRDVPETGTGALNWPEKAYVPLGCPHCTVSIRFELQRHPGFDGVRAANSRKVVDDLRTTRLTHLKIALFEE